MSASAGKRTRAACVTGEHSTIEPPMYNEGAREGEEREGGREREIERESDKERDKYIDIHIHIELVKPFRI